MAHRVVMLLLSFRFAFFLGFIYADGAFLLLILVFFYGWTKQDQRLMTGAAFLLAWARPQGVLLTLVVLLALTLGAGRRAGALALRFAVDRAAEGAASEAGLLCGLSAALASPDFSPPLLLSLALSPAGLSLAVLPSPVAAAGEAASALRKIAHLHEFPCPADDRRAW